MNAQKFYLMYLAGMDKNKYVKDSDYESLKKAYDKWDQRYYVVFYGDSAKWTCNLFVGEALYMAGKNSLTSSSKYYSAKQIWNEEGIFKQIKKSEVQRGDIVSFYSGLHVEIVSQVMEEGLIFKDKVSFCSRGAGRGSSDFGTEKCNDTQNSRLINKKDIKFLRVF